MTADGVDNQVKLLRKVDAAIAEVRKLEKRITAIEDMAALMTKHLSTRLEHIKKRLERRTSVKKRP